MKKISTAIFILALGCIISIPFQIHAETTSSPKAVCASLPEYKTRMMTELRERKSAYTNRQITRTDHLMSTHADRVTRTSSTRARADESRALMYQHIETLATTPEKIDAVNQFKATIDSALKARRAGVDDVVTTYEQNLSELVDSKFATAKSAFEKYEDALTSTFAEVERLCNDGNIQPKTVRTLLQEDLREARTLFKKTLVHTSFKASLEELQSARKKAIEDATSTYQKILQDSRITLEKTLAQ